MTKLSVIAKQASSGKNGGIAWDLSNFKVMSTDLHAPCTMTSIVKISIQNTFTVYNRK